MLDVMGPGQLYTTESGRYGVTMKMVERCADFGARLYHAGRIAIIMGTHGCCCICITLGIIVGLPARGKTHLSVALGRYLRW